MFFDEKNNNNNTKNNNNNNTFYIVGTPIKTIIQPFFAPATGEHVRKPSSQELLNARPFRKMKLYFNKEDATCAAKKKSKKADKENLIEPYFQKCGHKTPIFEYKNNTFTKVHFGKDTFRDKHLQDDINSKTWCSIL